MSRRVGRRVRLVRLHLGYTDGLVLHTATSGPVPGLDEIRLVVEEEGRVAALGSTRTNIAYLTGLAPEAIEAAVLDAAGALDWSLPWGDLVLALDRLRPDLPAPARMLFEMAAWDAQARAASVPLADLLAGPPSVAGTAGSEGLRRQPPAGGSSSSAGLRTPTNQTLFWGDEAALLARAEGYVARGFRELKLRVGVGDFAGDLARLRLLRGTFPELRLSIDVNGRWSPAEAPGHLEALTRLGLDYVEQPLPPDAWAETAALSRTTPVPIMLDEALSSPEAVRRLAETGAAALAHLKLAKLGGLDRLVEAARGLAGAGIGVMVGQMNEGAVSTAAIAHAAIAVDAPHRELYGADGIAGEPAGPPLRYEAGALHLPGGPGLGLASHPIDPHSVLWDHAA